MSPMPKNDVESLMDDFTNDMPPAGALNFKDIQQKKHRHRKSKSKKSMKFRDSSLFDNELLTPPPLTSNDESSYELCKL